VTICSNFPSNISASWLVTRTVQSASCLAHNVTSLQLDWLQDGLSVNCPVTITTAIRSILHINDERSPWAESHLLLVGCPSARILCKPYNHAALIRARLHQTSDSTTLWNSISTTSANWWFTTGVGRTMPCKCPANRRTNATASLAVKGSVVSRHWIWLEKSTDEINCSQESKSKATKKWKWSTVNASHGQLVPNKFRNKGSCTLSNKQCYGYG